MNELDDYTCSVALATSSHVPETSVEPPSSTWNTDENVLSHSESGEVLTSNPKDVKPLP